MNNMKNAFLVLLFTLCVNSGFSQTFLSAVSSGDSVTANEFIKKGADVNAVDGTGVSPLMGACRRADQWSVSFLLRHGAKADKPKSPKGRTPLMIACAYYSGKTICSMLIDYGADVNAVSNEGITPLMLAAQNAKLDVIELLLKKGAKAGIKDQNGKTAYNYAETADISDYLKQSVKDTRIDKERVMSLLSKAR
jgi:uncharacterized protein